MATVNSGLEFWASCTVALYKFQKSKNLTVHHAVSVFKSKDLVDNFYLNQQQGEDTLNMLGEPSSSNNLNPTY